MFIRWFCDSKLFKCLLVIFQVKDWNLKFTFNFLNREKTDYSELEQNKKKNHHTYWRMINDNAKKIVSSSTIVKRFIVSFSKKRCTTTTTFQACIFIFNYFYWHINNRDIVQTTLQFYVDVKLHNYWWCYRIRARWAYHNQVLRRSEIIRLCM